MSHIKHKWRRARGQESKTGPGSFTPVPWECRRCGTTVFRRLGELLKTAVRREMVSADCALLTVKSVQGL